jgi:AcrR family transcriptional regulator
MKTPPRILRAREQNRDPDAYEFTQRQSARHDRILAGSQCLLAEYGPDTIDFRDLATALRMATATLRFHFVDLHALLGTILRRHLRALAAALGKIPTDAPNRQELQRAAYLAYTRTPLGGFTEAHLLFVRDRHTLPPDQRETIELTRFGLGTLLAGDLGEEALLLLDAPIVDAARIEVCLAALNAPQAAEPAAPHHDAERRPDSRPKEQPLTEQSKPRPPPRRSAATPFLPAEDIPAEIPGDWIYAVGLPGVRAPPAAA